MTQPSPTPDDVRRLFDEASDGPWFVEPQDELNAAIYPLTVKNADWALAEVYGDVVELPADANARFIAAARSGWPADRERADRAEAALAFYADPDGDGYDVIVTDYGLSTDNGDIIKDRGAIARTALENRT